MYQTGRSDRVPCEAQTDRFLHTFAQLFVGDRGGDRAARARSSSRRRLERRSATALRRRLDGSGPGAKRTARRRRAASAISARALAELERPDRVGRVHVQRPVAGDARRPRVARDRGADRRRPALDELGQARPAGRSARARRGSRYRAGSMAPPPRAGRARPAARDACVAVITVWPMPATRAASTRRRPGSSSESTSSSSSSGAVGSSSASARSSESTASRCSPCEPKLRRSRSPLAISDVVEVRPEPGRAALEVALRAAPRASADGRRLARRSRAARRQAELVGALGEARRERGERLARAPSTSAAPSAATRSVHGASASRSARARAARGAARRSAARARRRSPAAGRRAPGRAGRARGRSTRGARRGRP